MPSVEQKMYTVPTEPGSKTNEQEKESEMGQRIMKAIRGIAQKRNERKQARAQAQMRAEEAELADRMIGLSGYVPKIGRAHV